MNCVIERPRCIKNHPKTHTTAGDIQQYPLTGSTRLLTGTIIIVILVDVCQRRHAVVVAVVGRRHLREVQFTIARVEYVGV